MSAAKEPHQRDECTPLQIILPAKGAELAVHLSFCTQTPTHTHTNFTPNSFIGGCILFKLSYGRIKGLNSIYISCFLADLDEHSLLQPNPELLGHRRCSGSQMDIAVSSDNQAATGGTSGEGVTCPLSSG